MKVKYSSNNSGGSWWLTDKQWLALEKAGWHVEWGGTYYCHDDSELSMFQRPNGRPEPCKSKGKCLGHRRYGSINREDRWLGAAAREAVGEFKSLADAVRAWEKATGLDASDEGCSCCGPPHSFSAEKGKAWEYASGSEIVGLLYPGSPTSLREAAERLA